MTVYKWWDEAADITEEAWLFLKNRRAHVPSPKVWPLHRHRLITIDTTPLDYHVQQHTAATALAAVQDMMSSAGWDDDLQEIVVKALTTESSLRQMDYRDKVKRLFRQSDESKR
jgi:hypothetical protein